MLGLTQDEAKDFSKIKSTYRRVIAQYHPDKVGDMGPEIKEIAEAKAKRLTMHTSILEKNSKETKNRVRKANFNLE